MSRRRKMPRSWKRIATAWQRIACGWSDIAVHQLLGAEHDETRLALAQIARQQIALGRRQLEAQGINSYVRPGDWPTEPARNLEDLVGGIPPEPADSASPQAAHLVEQLAIEVPRAARLLMWVLLKSPEIAPGLEPTPMELEQLYEQIVPARWIIDQSPDAQRILRGGS